MVAALSAAFALVSPVASAAIEGETLRVDLVPLINAAAGDSSRFAVEVPKLSTLSTDGKWSESAGTARWRYKVRVPGAVSVSFLAERVALPRGAVLTLTGPEAQYRYTAREIRNGQLWSRILRGDTLDVEISVPSDQRSATRFELVSIQAGYRSLAPGGANHPRFDAIRGQTARLRRYSGEQVFAEGLANASCLVGYRCEANSGNSGPAKASVAVVVSNLYQCSGTLVNNARSDGTPYVLTARHCQSGGPNSAAGITVYWNAQSDCGDVGNLFDPSIITQSGATTVVEQQDAWLVRLDETPRLPGPFFAGVDATGAPVTGGYSTHYALSTKEQFTQWLGTAAGVTFGIGEMGNAYAWSLLGVSPLRGFFGPGASGSALFDASNLLTGIASLGRDSDGGPGFCPAEVPTAPTPSTAAAYFTSLAGVWRSTADTSSSTGTATIAEVLDPDLSGTEIIAGSSMAPAVSLIASPTTAVANAIVYLTWQAGSSVGCTASGGRPGDNWAGSRSAAGSLAVISSTSGPVTYSLRCQYPGGREVEAAETVTYLAEGPHLRLPNFRGTIWVGAPLQVQWSSGSGPCVLTTRLTPFGPALTTQSGLSASGSTSLSFNEARDHYIQLACEGTAVAYTQTPVSAISPTLVFWANSTDRKNGQLLSLVWNSLADTCTPSGGASNDGWRSTQFSGDSSHQFTTSEVGTFAYTLTCSSGPVSITRSLSVRVTDEAPYALLSLSRNPVYIGQTYQIHFRSNIDNCTISGQPGHVPYPVFISAESTLSSIATNSPGPGEFVLQASCASAGQVASAAPVSLQVLAAPPDPTATLQLSSTAIELGQSATVTWTSANADSCTASGSDQFTGNVGTSGTRQINGNAVETLLLSVTCACPLRSVSASQSLQVKAASSPAPAGGGEKPASQGGGGSLGAWMLALLVSLGGLRARQTISRHRRGGFFQAE